MAKKVYRIPASLDRSFLDHEIALHGGGFQMRPLPLKVILFWVLSIFVLVWAAMNVLKDADWFFTLGIIIWWLITTSVLGSYSKAKEMKFSSIPSLTRYVGKNNRQLVTRKSEDPSAFYVLTGIDKIEDDGKVFWNDGTVGRSYLVVGSASILVFNEDKIAILDRVDAFYRKLDTTGELITITTKEPQRVWRQLANLDRRNRALTVRDPELFELMEEQYDILKDYVGGSFNSIHQYFVLKADNDEALRRLEAVVRAEVAESQLMIKQLTILDKNDTEEMLATVYRAGN